jgi:hypothetical protein
MDIKKFKKNIKSSCNFIVPPKQHKKCMDTMMCSWTHCQKEQQDLESAMLTNEESKSCYNKDFSKQFNCQQKITERKGLMKKNAILANCNANKCPQIRTFIEKATQEITKQIKDTKTKKQNNKKNTKQNTKKTKKKN